MRQKERIRNFVENALSESMDVQEQSMVLLGGDGDNGDCEKEEYGYNKDLCNNKDSVACRKMQASVQIAEYARTLLI